ncbi:MAG: type II secretion system F family protein [Terriglobales bacterium]
MLFLLVSAAITVFLLAAAIMLIFSSKESVEVRLMEVAARREIAVTGFDDEEKKGLAGLASGVTGLLKPVRDLIMANDEDMAYRLSLAGFRKPEHIEIYTAAKMLLPVAAIIGATFAGSNFIAVALVGTVLGFLGPDIVVTQMVKRRKEAINHALPDALDLLVICMEAGLGIDQALVRVGEDVRLTCPPLADEFLIINREQRAGKPRLDAWRSMAARVDLEYVRQFVAMLVQTERFGTPIANALGQFADSLRMKRMQAAEELAAKAGLKLLFPLVIFIFPAVFVVLLGPPALNIAKQLESFFGK